MSNIIKIILKEPQQIKVIKKDINVIKVILKTEG